MRVYSPQDETIVFRRHVGSGSFDGRDFSYSVTEPGGLPAVEADGSLVVFELGDLVPKAFAALNVQRHPS